MTHLHAAFRWPLVVATALLAVTVPVAVGPTAPVSALAGSDEIGPLLLDESGELLLRDPATRERVGEITLLQEGDHLIWQPGAFSPAGDRLLYWRSGREVSTPDGIWVRNADGTVERLMTPPDTCNNINLLRWMVWVDNSTVLLGFGCPESDDPEGPYGLETFRVTIGEEPVPFPDYRPLDSEGNPESTSAPVRGPDPLLLLSAAVGGHEPEGAHPEPVDR